MIAQTPEITVDKSGYGWRLMATSYGQKMPAGSRLFRAAPHPEILFFHQAEAAALTDAEKLRQYLSEQADKRGPSKAKLRRASRD